MEETGPFLAWAERNADALSVYNQLREILSQNTCGA